MATIGHGRNPGYVPQDGNWVECDRCGFEYRAYNIVDEWNGLEVCTDCWESRHPQDFLRVQEERIAARRPGTLSSSEVTTYSGIVGIAIAGVAIVGDGPLEPSSTIPPGTFNNEL
jgi:hypothetical protein